MFEEGPDGKWYPRQPTGQLSGAETWWELLPSAWRPWPTALCVVVGLAMSSAVIAFAAASNEGDEGLVAGGEQLLDGAITTRRSTPPTVSAPVGARGNPWPLGEVAVVRDRGEPSWEVNVRAVNADAFPVLSENPVNGPPTAGHRFVLVTVEAKRVGDGNAPPLAFTASDGAGTMYDHRDACGIVPVPLRTFGDVLSVEMSTNEAVNGNLCWSVDDSTAGSLALRVRPASAPDSAASYLALGWERG